MRKWLLEQWRDIKGNLKFWILTVVTTGIVTVGIWITHGLQWWQQLILAVLFLALFAIAIISAYAATWSSSSDGVITPENVQEKIREWLDTFELQVGRISPPNCHFGWQVTLRNGVIMWLLRTTGRERYITFLATVAATEGQIIAFNNFLPEDRLRFWRDLYFETSRSKITALRNPNNTNVLSRFTVEYLLPITSDLSEATVIQTVRDLDFSVYIVRNALDYLLPTAAPIAALGPAPETGTPPASANPVE